MGRLRVTLGPAGGQPQAQALALLLQPTSSALADHSLRYPRPMPGHEQRNSYIMALLQLTLDKAGSHLRLQPSEHYMEQRRALRELQLGRSVDVVWAMTSRERETELLPIRIPLDKGLLGYRLFLIMPQTQAKLDAVKSLDELKKFSIGQASPWTDVKILEANQFNVVIADNYEGLFQMLGINRFDLFSRGVNEIYSEWEGHRAQVPGLSIEKNMVLAYPMPRYFFVPRNKDGEKMAERIEDGLRRLARQNPEQAIELLDVYGSPDLSDSFVEELTVAGVVFRYYDPRPRLFGMRTNLFRRMHRKIVVIDDRVAFVGGINYSAEHMSDYGPEAKQDYAVRVEGPVVADILKFVLENLPGQSAVRRWWRRHHRAIDNHRPGEAQALFVWRDNQEHRDDIERHYLKMLTQARREVIIANAYFFPGYRLLHAMKNAARRGVRVKLIVQGEPDMPIVKVGARLLYNYLVKGGVHVYEYRRKPLHGKVALMDDHWATVGSSNLDPLSLSLNLEANLIIHDRTFNQTLRDNLNPIIAQDCKRVDESMLPKRTWWNLTKSVLAFHFLRHFPALVGWLPAHTPHLAEVEPPAQPALETQDRIQTEDAGGKT